MVEASRRLVGILVADVVGYSGMVSGDETSIVAQMRAMCSEIIEPFEASHQGWVFRISGDRFLVEFARAVHLLRSATALALRASVSQPQGQSGKAT
jgi:adenylate cyclase